MNSWRYCRIEGKLFNQMREKVRVYPHAIKDQIMKAKDRDEIVCGRLTSDLVSALPRCYRRRHRMTLTTAASNGPPNPRCHQPHTGGGTQDGFSNDTFFMRLGLQRVVFHVELDVVIVGCIVAPLGFGAPLTPSEVAEVIPTCDASPDLITSWSLPEKVVQKVAITGRGRGVPGTALHCQKLGSSGLEKRRRRLCIAPYEIGIATVIGSCGVSLNDVSSTISRYSPFYSPRSPGVHFTYSPVPPHSGSDPRGLKSLLGLNWLVGKELRAGGRCGSFSRMSSGRGRFSWWWIFRLGCYLLNDFRWKPRIFALTKSIPDGDVFDHYAAATIWASVKKRGRGPASTTNAPLDLPANEDLSRNA
ncbi:uncharacterized protein EV422DRAFT_503853 [Fimicolochytrium jonesii]|uniref:uncharacterized protein n=1 Tax=Fimicolochytrium jonesii TaxID=1396493 RepID=UPI0022FE2FCE|nr:uncharacterized protein EV422DRAFT_503853 [Fimicolochytrium jonesii]KAI8825090.1 hypothetical protein EV422DRAFT_503853 [Fimicolochytrium jonesii]